MHVRPTPRTAGIVLWLILIMGQATGHMPFHLDLLDWVGVHFMAFIGLMDDRFNLRARYKAMAGLAVAAMLSVHVALSLGRVAGEVTLLGLTLPNHPAVFAPILLLWFWALPQAYNLIDGINGLSMGYAALLLGVLGWNLGVQPTLLWGGLGAVLVLNFPKARHFLGDCGALMLGTFFSILGVEAFALKDPNLLLWVFAYPILDVCLVVGIRRWKGLPLGEADRSHLHHWMMDRMNGRSWLATPVLLGLAALPMLRATGIPGGQVASLLGLAALMALAFKAFKDRVTAKAAVVESAQVRRKIPFMVSSGIREASGSHPRL